MRRKTREVLIGKVGVGGENPIRIQSMTTSPTHDVQATIEQILKLQDQGCEIVRVTVQGKREARACEAIKDGLLKRGCTIPLVADIHFYPPAALLVADFVDKVRINPGNYLDRRAVFKIIEYSDVSYAEEIQKIEEGLFPLVEKCKQRNIALRIGVNHGSLSDRIMSRYGDTASGMVESALEFARVCHKYDFHDLVFSMKASNPLIMIEAYRLLALQMAQLGWDYPLHLGVTEAGDGEDGRVKSAVGIGTLLLEGLGDTIRVSLTENPWEEIDPCKRLIRLAETKRNGVYRKSKISPRKQISSPHLHSTGTVVLSVLEEDILQDDFYEQIGYRFQKKHETADLLWLKKPLQSPIAQKKAALLQEVGIYLIPPQIPFVQDENWQKLLSTPPEFVLLKVDLGRRFAEWARENNFQVPIILCASYPQLSSEDVVIHAAAELGSLLADGIGDGICIEADQTLNSLRNLSFSILAAARLRFAKTDYIACPGCGRTLFNLQEVTKRIRSKTSHLPGVKIAIMGCIVNGPGEMADADFGYVGSRSGKVDLYVGKTCVERNIDESIADDKLIELIKSHDRWMNLS